MRRLAAALACVALAAPAFADDALPADLDRLLWCSSAFYWLASDAYDGGDDAEGQQYQDWSDRLADQGATGLKDLGKTDEQSAAISDGYDERVVVEMKGPTPKYDVTTDCTALIPAD